MKPAPAKLCMIPVPHKGNTSSQDLRENIAKPAGPINNLSG